MTTLIVAATIKSLCLGHPVMIISVVANIRTLELVLVLELVLTTTVVATIKSAVLCDTL